MLTSRQPIWIGWGPELIYLYNDPYKSIIRWSWTQHATYQQRFTSAMSSPAYRHLRFVRLRSRAEMDRWLNNLDRSAHDA